MDNTVAGIVGDIDTGANTVASFHAVLKAVGVCGDGITIGSIDAALDLVFVIVFITE